MYLGVVLSEDGRIKCEKRIGAALSAADAVK